VCLHNSDKHRLELLPVDTCNQCSAFLHLLWKQTKLVIIGLPWCTRHANMELTRSEKCLEQLWMRSQWNIFKHSHITEEQNSLWYLQPFIAHWQNLIVIYLFAAEHAWTDRMRLLFANVCLEVVIAYQPYQKWLADSKLFVLASGGEKPLSDPTSAPAMSHVCGLHFRPFVGVCFLLAVGFAAASPSRKLTAPIEVRIVSKLSIGLIPKTKLAVACRKGCQRHRRFLRR